jgi:hypothetical protein
VSSSSLTWRSHRGVVEVGVVDVGVLHRPL